MMNLRELKNKILFYVWSFKNDSYAQEGEDLILRRYFEDQPKRKGFFVDIGAHHPKRFSNTYRFYKRGWRGINVDATPGSMLLFKIWRRKDTNLELGITGEKSVLTFFMFDDPALNGFHEKMLDSWKTGRYRVIREVKVQTYPLSEVLQKHVPPNTPIDFMTIDVEGKDLEVIQSNDWKKYRPKMVLIEAYATDLESLLNTGANQIMTGLNYKLYAKTVNTLFYVDTIGN